MTQETVEAFCRLVTLYARALVNADVDVPADLAERVAREPRAACETMNALALSCGAIDDQLDRLLATVYASMDAADARTTPGAEAGALLARTYERAAERAARPKPAPTPAPAPEPAVEPAPAAAHAPEPSPSPAGEKTGTPVASASPDAEATPRRRRTRAAKPDASAATEPDAASPVAPEPAPEAAAESQPVAMPAVTDTAAAPSASPAAPATPEPEATPAPVEDQTLTVDQTAAILGTTRQKVYKLIEAGTLPAHKKGRSWQISAAAVTALAAAK